MSAPYCETANTKTDGFTVPLRDGELVQVRPIQPADRHAIDIGYTQLSDETKFARFLTLRPVLSSSLLTYFSEVDQIDHVAWGVGRVNRQPDEPGIGIGRYVRLSDEPSVAEFALTVSDDYQRQGFGTLLLALLYHLAQCHGEIAILRGIIGADNHRMISWMRLLGADVNTIETGTVQADLHVTVPPQLPDNRTAQRFGKIVQRFQHCPSLKT